MLLVFHIKNILFQTLISFLSNVLFNIQMLRRFSLLHIIHNIMLDYLIKRKIIYIIHYNFLLKYQNYPIYIIIIPMLLLHLFLDMYY